MSEANQYRAVLYKCMRRADYQKAFVLPAMERAFKKNASRDEVEDMLIRAVRRARPDVEATHMYSDEKSIPKAQKDKAVSWAGRQLWDDYVKFRNAAKKETPKMTKTDEAKLKKGKNLEKALSSLWGKRELPPLNTHEARELELFAENDQQCYRQAQSIQLNLVKKMIAGTFDFAKSKTLWENWANAAAQKYTRDHIGRGSHPHKSYGIFSPAMRRNIASRAAHEFASAAVDNDFASSEASNLVERTARDLVNVQTKYR